MCQAKLRRFLPDHEVSRAADHGWEELKNGDLLRQAEIAGYQVMVTGDQSIPYQQNLSGRRIALVVLSTNNWHIIKSDLDRVVSALRQATPGSFAAVDFGMSWMPRKRKRP